MVFDTTFNNIISCISWQSVLLLEEIGVPRESSWMFAKDGIKIFWKPILASPNYSCSSSIYLPMLELKYLKIKAYEIYFLASIIQYVSEWSMGCFSLKMSTKPVASVGLVQSKQHHRHVIKKVQWYSWKMALFGITHSVKWGYG